MLYEFRGNGLDDISGDIKFLETCIIRNTQLLAQGHKQLLLRDKIHTQQGLADQFSADAAFLQRYFQLFRAEQPALDQEFAYFRH